MNKINAGVRIRKGQNQRLTMVATINISAGRLMKGGAPMFDAKSMNQDRDRMGEWAKIDLMEYKFRVL